MQQLSLFYSPAPPPPPLRWGMWVRVLGRSGGLLADGRIVLGRTYEDGILKPIRLAGTVTIRFKRNRRMHELQVPIDRVQSLEN